VPGQRKVDEKSNEITAIPDLLDKLEISGCIVTLDAMGCQTKIAETIVDKGADYVLALKENHGQLYEDVTFLFDDLAQSGFTVFPHEHAKSVDKGHGRIEVRQAWTIDAAHLIANLRTTQKWPHLTTLVKVQAERYLNGKFRLKLATLSHRSRPRLRPSST
jgi:predicted transposase YbfD/YdcC